jgi:diaminohydroxyphosphoribosylaminopyrimidine deaminase/5-amino-6-(5-phosphoribosylamino)uracil reductase
MNGRNQHEIYMRRCFQLALNGRGTTAPNPMVGAVIVHDGRIIGEGWHYKAGLPHAEVMAIESVKEKALLKESTLYVNLEPCSHHGRTPACSTRIIREGIPRVVIANRDPNPLVAGRGVEALRRNGIEVIEGVLEDEGNELNRFFFTCHRHKRPYVILKWAQSADGFIAPPGGRNVKISSLYSRLLVHRWRSAIQSILIGRHTLDADRPRLDARYWDGNDPVVVVLGGKKPYEEDYPLFSGKRKLIVFGKEAPPARSQAAHYPYATVQTVLKTLCRHDIQSVLVEGGSHVLQQFIAAGLWDEARIFTAPHVLGEGVKAPLLPQKKWLFTRFVDKDKWEVFVHPANQYLVYGRYL